MIKKTKNGISLIILVITIIIMLIITGAIISFVMTSDENIFIKAKKASFLNDYSLLEEALVIKISESAAQNNGFPSNEEIDNITIKELAPTLSEKQSKKFAIQDLKIVLTEFATQQEKEWIYKVQHEIIADVLSVTTNDISIKASCKETVLNYTYYIGKSNNSYNEMHTNENGEYTFTELEEGEKYYIKIIAHLKNNINIEKEIIHYTDKCTYIMKMGDDNQDFPYEVTTNNSNPTYGRMDIYEDHHRIIAARNDTRTAINTTNKINLTNYKTIELDVDLKVDGNISGELHLCVSQEKDNTINGNAKTVGRIINITSYQNKILTLDVSHLTGEYYIKCVLVHGPEQSLYTAFAKINSFKLISNNEIKNNEAERYIIKNSNVYYNIAYSSYNTQSSYARLDNSSYDLFAAYKNNRTAMYTTEKHDLTNYNKLKISVGLLSNNSSLSTKFYAGICNEKDYDITFVEFDTCEVLSTEEIKNNMEIDISELTGEFYIKCIVAHGSEVTANTSIARIYNLELTN